MTIHCCVCLNIDNHQLVEATTVANGYSVCEQHAPFLAGEFSDLAQLIGRIKNQPTENAT